jgi:hypothetical protein
MVSFDRWQSFDIQNELQSVGVRTETVSVAKKHYEDLAMMVYEERVAMPMIPLLLEELSELKIMNKSLQLLLLMLLPGGSQTLRAQLILAM